jgi:DNA processing protein
MPLGWQPRAKDFPRRNRIISGLAMGVVVVEATERSGSLVTARRAIDQNRLVFAVPGSPVDPRCGGTNRLLKDGATLVTSAEDVLAEVSPMLGYELPPLAIADGDSPPVPPAEPEDAARARVEGALGKAPVTVDEIVRSPG